MFIWISLKSIVHVESTPEQTLPPRARVAYDPKTPVEDIGDISLTGYTLALVDKDRVCREKKPVRLLPVSSAEENDRG